MRTGTSIQKHFKRTGFFSLSLQPDMKTISSVRKHSHTNTQITGLTTHHIAPADDLQHSVVPAHTHTHTFIHTHTHTHSLIQSFIHTHTHTHTSHLERKAFCSDTDDLQHAQILQLLQHRLGIERVRSAHCVRLEASDVPEWVRKEKEKKKRKGRS